MRKNYLISKRGVSLITVLMFMLVATIAATATWKFITSEGFSSTSRMLKREAYQSAQAGIENARSWMTFHANDVGALIKQFKDNNGKAINLDDQLRSLQRAGQNYHVWLTGVNTDNGTYKLKILSSGEARNNTSHTEVAIFNVDGLYRVQLPRVESSSNFAEAFHGDLRSIDKLNIDKAVITQTPAVKNNGGQALNNITVSEYLILDGSFYANSTNTVKDLYATGNVGTCSGINVTNNLYVGGVFFPGNVKSTIAGSLYTVGGINLRDSYTLKDETGGCGSKTSGDFEVTGNITSEGPLYFYDNGGTATFVAKNSLVITRSDSGIVFPTSNPASTVQEKMEVKHNVYVKGDSKGYMGNQYVYCGYSSVNDGRDAIPRVKLGSGSGDKVWLKGFLPYLTGTTQASFSICSDPGTNYCKVGDYTCARSGGYKKWVGFKGTFLDTEPSETDIASWNADKMEKYKEKIQDRDETCNKVKTPIQFNKQIFNLGITHSKDHTFDCDAKIWSEWENTSALINACYDKAKANGKLYNNEWLIMEFDSPVGWQKNNMKTELSGSFVFKIKASSGSVHQINLPPTGVSSKVMLYLPDGWPDHNQDIEFADASGIHRYFVFTEGDVQRFDMKDISTPMSGSVVVASCASFSTAGNNTLNVLFDQELTDDLADASIICDNDGSDECSLTGSVASSSSGSSGDDGYDQHYISVAPQLGVSLESQSKSFEKVTESDKLASSFIILPRVISLPRDPYGTLGDYLNVITLNKPQNAAPLTKANLDLANSCTKLNGYSTLGISSLNSKLFSPEGSKLAKGTYRCNISADGYNGTVPVYVVIDSKELRDLHQVAFAEASQEIGGNNDSKDIYVRLQPKIPTINLNVSCPDAPSNWEYTYVRNSVATGGTCTFTLSNPLTTEKTEKLFTVKTTGATSGSMVFQLLEQGEGDTGADYIITDPGITSVYISSVATLTRDPATFEQINEFCGSNTETCPTEDERYNWPDCSIAEGERWVEPDGAGFQTETTNDSWLITSAVNTEVKLTDVSSDKCVVIIPEDEKCTFTDEEKSCTLHASAKVKVNTVKFKFKHVEEGTNPFFTVTRGADVKTCTYDDNSAHECTVNVYDGGPVSMNIETSYSDNKDFTYWLCEGPSCPDNEKLKSKTYRSFTVSDNETIITVMFNEVDKHCFFDKFENSTAACEDLPSNVRKEYCIDYCSQSSNCTSAATDAGTYADAKWHLLSGKMNMIDYENGVLSVFKNGDVTVMSTINADAGTHGSLKALVRLPKGNAESGFLLASNASASSFLKLNLFIDNNGYVNAKVCDKSSLTCEQEVFATSATENDMIMVEAEIDADKITVSITKDNESTKASKSFSLGSWSESIQGSYVGFRIASPKFKLFGIGWKSKNYECFDTYPTIKCSFAAVAQYGVVPRGIFVKPWVGYSGWEGWNTSNCTEKYYYQGDDACAASTSAYSECDNEGYFFDSTSSGKHGYTDLSGNDVRTAKVGLDCETQAGSTTEEMMWASDSAHCGIFWTGPQNSCTMVDKITAGQTLYASDEWSGAFDRAVNMRAAKIWIETDNKEGNEIWITLLSEGLGDELYPSEHVVMNEEARTFDISDFESETGGFDKGKVKQVLITNKSNASITIKNVSTVCATAVRVKSCKAVEKNKSSMFYGWINWYAQKNVEITAVVNNRDGVEKYQVIAERSDGKTKTYELEKSDVLITGNENTIISLRRDLNNIYGVFNDWTFSIRVKSDGADYGDPVECNATTTTAPTCKIETPTTNAVVNQDAVEFKGKLENCEGCQYIVTIDDKELITESCTEVTGATKKCDVRIAKDKLSSLTIGENHTFKFYSPSNEFTACERTFTVREKPEAGGVDVKACEVTSVDGSSVTVQTDITGCPAKEECTYSVDPSADDYGKAYTDKQTITFSYAGEGKGTVKHTLTIKKKDKESDSYKTGSCSFDVTYANSSSEEESSSSEEVVESSSSHIEESASSEEIDLNNATSYKKDEEKYNSEATTVKYTLTTSSTLKVGCWWAPSPPVSVSIRNCDGTISTFTHYCGGWINVYPNGICTVYLKPETPIKWKFHEGDW